MFSEAVHDLFDVEVPAWEQSLASDTDETRLSLIGRQHPGLRILCGDIAQLERTQVWNSLRGRWVPVPFGDMFYGGFSCKDLSTKNSQRSALRGGLRAGRGSTGETFFYILKVRPMISVLENVEKLGQDYVQTDDQDCAIVLNDLSWIVDDFAEHAMTVVSAPVDRARFDSPHDGVRQWLAIYDVHPDIARPHLPFFHRVLDSMASPRGEPRMSLAPFLFDEDIVQELMEGVQVKPLKAAKTGLALFSAATETGVP